MSVLQNIKEAKDFLIEPMTIEEYNDIDLSGTLKEMLNLVRKYEKDWVFLKQIGMSVLYSIIILCLHIKLWRFRRKHPEEFI